MAYRFKMVTMQLQYPQFESSRELSLLSFPVRSLLSTVQSRQKIPRKQLEEKEIVILAYFTEKQILSQNVLINSWCLFSFRFFCFLGFLIFIKDESRARQETRDFEGEGNDIQ